MFEREKLWEMASQIACSFRGIKPMDLEDTIGNIFWHYCTCSALMKYDEIWFPSGAMNDSADGGNKKGYINFHFSSPLQKKGFTNGNRKITMCTVSNRGFNQNRGNTINSIFIQVSNHHVYRQIYPKNHGISGLVVWRSQNPAKNRSKPLFFGGSQLILRVTRGVNI